MPQRTHYVTTHVINAALTADFERRGANGGPVQPFVVRVIGTIAPLVLEDAMGRELTITNAQAGMVNQGLDAPILFNKVKRQSNDRSQTTGTLNATNYLLLAWPNVSA